METKKILLGVITYAQGCVPPMCGLREELEEPYEPLIVTISSNMTYGASIRELCKTGLGPYVIGDSSKFRIKQIDPDSEEGKPGFVVYDITSLEDVLVRDNPANHLTKNFIAAAKEYLVSAIRVFVPLDKNGVEPEVGRLTCCPTIDVVEFPPHKKVPKHWMAIVDTEAGHTILIENGTVPLFGPFGILEYHTFEKMKEQKKIGAWSFHLGKPSLPIIVEITMIEQSASEEQNGNCKIVFHPVEGSIVRCFNGNPHLMGQHLKECRGFEISLEWNISSALSNPEVTRVTYLPLEQDE